MNFKAIDEAIEESHALRDRAEKMITMLKSLKKHNTITPCKWLGQLVSRSEGVVNKTAFCTLRYIPAECDGCVNYHKGVDNAN